MYADNSWNKERLQGYIDNQIEESLTLDYKAAPALDRTDGKRKEITKDISAMANSAGGVLIYGIAEYPDVARKHLPERIDPVSRTQFTKEWLESIANNIHPRIQGLQIVPITLDTNNDHVAYVVEIPQSNTAHQAMDLRYYKRYNFQSIPMEDHEIRDVMGRDKDPRISLEFVLIREVKEGRPNFPGSLGLMGGGQPVKYSNNLVLRVYGRNEGNVFAQYVHGNVIVPARVCKDESAEIVHVDGEEYRKYIVNNERREFIGMEGSGVFSRHNFGPVRFEPILRGTRKYLGEDIILDDSRLQNFSDDDVVRWNVIADNAEIHSGTIKLVDIPIDDRT